MKKSIRLILVVMLLIVIVACQQKELAHMISKGQDDEYVVLWEDREYSVYGIIQTDCVGEQIGIVDDQENAKIYELIDYSTDEWIVSVYGEIDEDSKPVLLIEKNVSEVPSQINEIYIQQ